MKNIKLFCFPHAGGSAAIYNSWKNGLSEEIELKALELRGRGKRFGSPMYESFEEAVDDLYYTIEDEIEQGDYAMFGHSMGGILVYELLRKLRVENKRLPVHMFFSGSCPPHIKCSQNKKMHLLSDEQLLYEINKYGGVSEEVINCKELVDIMIPIIRADYKILENRMLTQEHKPFDIDITVMGGKDDQEVSEQELEEWSGYTTQSFRLLMYNGGHFFIESEKEKVLNVLSSTLAAHCKPGGA